jgi:hypothetical protein
MTTLFFTLDADLMKAAGPEVPVEVVRTDMVLVKRTTSNVPLKVPPGEYFVAARLPGIESTVKRIVVSDDEASAEIELAGRVGDAPQQVALAREPGVAGLFRRYGWDVPANYVRGSLVSVRMRIFEGNIFDPEELRPIEAPRSGWSTEREGPQVTIAIPPSSQPTLAQLLFLGLAPINVMLPISAEVGCSLLVRLRVPAPLIDCSIQHPQASLLLRLRRSGHLGATEAMLSSPEMSAERLLVERTADPIAAAVGAYTLLRMGNLDVLGEWTQSLLERFPKLPDGAVIRGEHLARLGRHPEAASAFGEVRRRGLPILLDGLLFLSSRLGYYASARNLLEESGVAAVKGLQEQLEDIMPFVDSRNTFSSFTGLDPKHPDDTALLYPWDRGATPIT